MKNVVTRTLSGVIYVTVFVLAILFGAATFGILALFLAMAGVWEYFALEKSRGGTSPGMTVRVVTLAVTAMVIASSYLPAAMTLDITGCSGFFGILWLFVPFYVVAGWVVLMIWCTFSSASDSARYLGVYLTAIFYIVLPLTLLSFAFYQKDSSLLVLAVLVAIWINDTGAYCVGCLFGRHKLCERVSPKKTWEGFFGGMLFVVVGAVIFAVVKGFNPYVYGIAGILLSVLATLGDLFESRLKRLAGVKDSGRIIPGHGGVLDRIDSFLMAIYLIFPLYILTF